MEEGVFDFSVGSIRRFTSSNLREREQESSLHPRLQTKVVKVRICTSKKKCQDGRHSLKL